MDKDKHEYVTFTDADGTLLFAKVMDRDDILKLFCLPPELVTGAERFVTTRAEEQTADD